MTDSRHSSKGVQAKAPQQHREEYSLKRLRTARCDLTVHCAGTQTQWRCVISGVRDKAASQGLQFSPDFVMDRDHQDVTSSLHDDDGSKRSMSGDNTQQTTESHSH